MDQVRADKEREATDGHDGTWVAHPGLVPLAKEVFDQHMPEANQIQRKLSEIQVTAADLLTVPKGEVTAAGLRQNIAVSVGYLESWLRGIGCVPLFNLMEDAATAEISRSQLWQWVHHKVHLSDGRLIDFDLCAKTLEEELARLRVSIGNLPPIAGQYDRAAALLLDLIRSEDFVQFLTLPGYDQLEPADAEQSQKH
jgi:malate synthase